MPQMTTELALRMWSYGQTQAERMVAQILHLEGYPGIEPQHPLGGPDGKKDVLFVRDGGAWLAAAFFPTTEQTFAATKAKFEEDLSGVSTNHCAGIAFFTNQYLTISERAELIRLASPEGGEIYDRERISRILDSPRGCGIRLQYLRITMSEEEQWAFWQVMNADISQQMIATREQLNRIERGINQVFARTNNLLFNATAGPSSMDVPQKRLVFATSALDTDLLCWIHRIATADSDIPEEMRGRIRTVDVWLAKRGTAYGSANWHPPVPESIPQELTMLCEWWRNIYPSLLIQPRTEVILALAKLHYEVLILHPFFDGNGRVARLLIDQAAHELLGVSVSKELTTNRSAYFSALEQADCGDINPLVSLITAALS